LTTIAISSNSTYLYLTLTLIFPLLTIHSPLLNVYSPLYNDTATSYHPLIVLHIQSVRYYSTITPDWSMSVNVPLSTTN